MPQMILDPNAKYNPECPVIPSPFSTPTIKLPKASRQYRNNCFVRLSIIATVRNYMRVNNVQSGVFPLACPLHHFCVKFGVTVQLAEAAALRFVRKNSSVPVPKVYSAFQHRNIKYIVMQNVSGDEIGKGWEQRPEEEKRSLLQQLKTYFDELRSIPHPYPGTIAAADMGPLADFRIFKGALGFGPFAKEDDFHRFLRYGLKPDYDILRPGSRITEEEREELRRMVKLQDEKSHKVVFTHGDVSSSNIIVKDGKIAALIDFEMSGFYPEYWEYTTSINVNRFDGFWKEEIPKFLDVYPRELEMETTRRKHFGAKGFRGKFAWW